jgi:aminoglycoside phosphotransferase (APT) family kinase protein
MLASEDGARIAGIIDWGDLAFGDPALDFVGVARGCPAATLDALLAAYGPTDDRLRERIALYGQLIPFHQLYYGLELGDDAIIAEAVAAIEMAAPA